MSQIPESKYIGKSLQSIRKEAGFKSAESFAAHIGMKTSAYTEYEQGRRSFTFEQAWIMADALHCSLDELGGRQWPAPESTDAMTAEEQKLVADYRDTHDYFKPEITHFAEDQAERHPKNEAAGNPWRQLEKGA